MNKIILDLCGGTGAWSKPYKDNGYDVINVTLPEHDVRLYEPPKNVYGILAAPPCTMFSFARTNAKKPRDLREGMEVVRACLDIIWRCMEVKQSTAKKTLPLKFWALENPETGFLSHFLGNPTFSFNPWQYGDYYQKASGLWGYFNEPKKLFDKPSRKMKKFDYMKSKDIAPEMFGKLSRTERRAITPEGFAKAFFEANK